MVPQSVAAMLPIEKAFCSKTIRALLATKCAEPFRKPVDPDFYGIPDYFDIVKNPMDLGTIKNKFEKDQYKTIAEFNGDINLMFYNCFLYNHETDPVCNDAKVLQGVFKKLLQRFNESNNSIQPKPKKTPVKTTPHPVTPVSNDSFNDDEGRSDTLSESDDRFADLFGDEELSEQEDMEDEEKRGEKRAADDGQQEMPEDQKKRCSNMINELKKRKHEHLTWAFKAPVDPSVWGCRDYYDVVKTPMDMSTYEHKFITNQYQHEDQLAADIRLMFSNCYLYNPPDNPVHQSCQKLEMLFDSYWAKLRADGQEHRPRKKLKMINTQGTKKDPGSHVASSAGTTLRIKLQHKPKVQDHNDRPSVMIETASSTAGPTKSDNVQHRRASLSSLSSNSSSSSRPKLAISREPPPSLKRHSSIGGGGGGSGGGDDGSCSSQSSASSGNGYQMGDIYPEAPSRKASLTDDHRRSSTSSSCSSVNSTIDYKATNNPPRRPSHHEGPAPVYTTTDKKSTSNNPNSNCRPPTTSSSRVAHAGGPPPPTRRAPLQRQGSTPLAPQKRPPQKAPAIVSVFDLVDRFENEKKTRQEQEERERQKTERERQEYMKKAKAEAEKDKLYRERKEEIKKADREKRMAELNTNTIDISRQKMLLNQFERDVLRQDKDFRELGHHYFKTTDYRTNIPPPFLHRLDIDLNHIGKSLLSAAGKYANTTDDEESDMDMGSETGMEDLD